MLKKLALMAMSVAALVSFAAPAAQAEGPLITDFLGEAPTNIVAESKNTITQTPVGTLNCTTVHLNVHLTTNANTTAHGHGTGEAFGTPNVTPHSDHCASSSGLLVDITSATLNTIHLTKHNGETTGTASFTYTYDLIHPLFGFLAECTIHGEATVKRTAEDAISISGKGLVGTGLNPCPTEGEISINGDFTVTAGGEPAVIH